MRHLPVLLLCSTLLLRSFSLAQEVTPTPLPTDAPEAPSLLSPQEEQKISFPSAKVQLWLNKPQVICFKVDHPNPFQRRLDCKADAAFLNVIDPPFLAENRSVGYLRVIPTQAGQTSLTLEGIPLAIEIKQDDLAIVLKRSGSQIVSPAQGSIVWNNFVVGVDRADSSDRTCPSLHLPNGEELHGELVPGQTMGTTQHFFFHVQVQDLDPGPNLITVTDSENDADPNSPQTPARPLILFRTINDPKIILQDRFENVLTADQKNGTATTASLVVDDSTLGKVVLADSGKIVVSIDVAERGTYQMMVNARGTISGDSLPAIGVTVDQATGPTTSAARLATTEWQQIPLGQPFTLDPGNHVLNVILNNRDSGCSLVLDQFQVAKIETADFVDPFHPAPHPIDLPSSGEPMMLAAQASSLSQNSYANSSNFGVVFGVPLQNETITQKLHLTPTVFWPHTSDAEPPPTIQLKINDNVVYQATTQSFDYWVPFDYFKAGKNTIQLVGILQNGQTTWSPKEDVIVPSELANPAYDGKIGTSYHFTSYAPEWAASPNIDKGGATVQQGDSLTLTLPDSLAGTYNIVADVWANHPEGSPSLTTIMERQMMGDRAISQVLVTDHEATVPLATVAFEPGNKSLKLQFGATTRIVDSKLTLRAINLEPVLPASAHLPIAPIPTILYPKPSATVGQVDGVVAQVLSRDRVTKVDLLVDGNPQHFDLDPSQKNLTGPIFFPLITRTLSPGPHTLKIVASDDSGRTSTGSDLPFTVAGPDQTPDPTFSKAVFVLNRFAYGPEPRQLAKILLLGPKEYLKQALYATAASPEEEDEQRWLRLQYPNADTVVDRAANYLLTEPNPVRARFVMWSENHFNTWIRKVGGPEKSQEHDAFARIGPAPFIDLLLTSASSAAMITYLDQKNSIAEKLNENYAREIMELHTLGVKGGYTQQDVTTLADLLTGWTSTQESDLDGTEIKNIFRYNPENNSHHPCQILGMEFPGTDPEYSFDRIHKALEMLVAHPSCSQFISRKLLEHYVQIPASPELVETVAGVYRQTGGDLREMLIALLDQPEFWNAPLKVASPLDYSIRTSRIAASQDVGAVNSFLTVSGMGLFDCVTPNGYPEDDSSFCSSNALLQRWNFAKNLASQWVERDALPCTYLEGDWDDPTLQRAIDLLAVRTTGGLLSQASNEATMTLLRAHGDLSAKERTELLSAIINQLPETNMR